MCTHSDALPTHALNAPVRDFLSGRLLVLSWAVVLGDVEGGACEGLSKNQEFP